MFMLNHGYERKNKYRKQKWERRTLPKPERVKDDSLYFSKPRTQSITNPKPYINQQLINKSDVIGLDDSIDVIAESNKNIDTDVWGVSYNDASKYADKLLNIVSRFTFIYGLVFASMLLSAFIAGTFLSRFSDTLLSHPEWMLVFAWFAGGLVFLTVGNFVFYLLIQIYQLSLRISARDTNIVSNKETDGGLSNKLPKATMLDNLCRLSANFLIFAGICILIALLLFLLQQNTVVLSPEAASVGITLVFAFFSIALIFAILSSINIYVINRIHRLHE